MLPGLVLAAAVVFFGFELWGWLAAPPAPPPGQRLSFEQRSRILVDAREDCRRNGRGCAALGRQIAAQVEADRWADRSKVERCGRGAATACDELGRAYADETDRGPADSERSKALADLTCALLDCDD